MNIRMKLPVLTAIVFTIVLSRRARRHGCPGF